MKKMVRNDVSLSAYAEAQSRRDVQSTLCGCGMLAAPLGESRMAAATSAPLGNAEETQDLPGEQPRPLPRTSHQG